MEHEKLKAQYNIKTEEENSYKSMSMKDKESSTKSRVSMSAKGNLVDITNNLVAMEVNENNVN